MNISGIRPNSGFYDYNSIKFRSEAIKNDSKPQQEETTEAIKPATSQVSEEEIAAAREAQTFGSYEFSLQYKPEETHEMVGADSDIHSLDVERAVNDMQRDFVIHQYQFFVQGVDPSQELDQEPSLRGAEDFVL